MKVKEFREAIEREYGKFFDGSRCEVRLTHILGDMLWVDCFLSADDGECAYRIKGNDMMHIGFKIDRIGNNLSDESELPEPLVMEVYTKHYFIAPEKRYYAYDMRRMPFRKVSGDAAKLVKALAKDFRVLRDNLQADFDAGKIHNEHRDLLEKRLIRA